MRQNETNKVIGETKTTCGFKTSVGVCEVELPVNLKTTVKKKRLRNSRPDWLNLRFKVSEES